MRRRSIARASMLVLSTVLACNDDGDGRGTVTGGVGGGECITPSGRSCEVPECDDPCAHNDPRSDVECVVTVPSEECVDVRGVEITFQQQGATVAAPGGFFKTDDAALQKWIAARWQELADFTIPANVNAQLTAGGVKAWNYPDGNGWIRTDFHAGILALPQGKTPQQLLREILDDPEAATGKNEFSGWVGWPAVGAGKRAIGDRIDLDIWGGDDGAIGYWKIDVDRFCVITLQNSTAGTHPVSGIRCWGFVPIAINPNWLKIPDNQKKWGCAGATYMFYTMGIDSPNVAFSGGVGSDLQAGTWNSLIRDLLRENDKAGGVSGRWFVQQTIAQSNSLKPKSGVAVTPPGELKSYYVSLPSDDQREGEVCETPMAPAGSCGEGQFTCADGQCIEQAKRCDGTGDCTDRDDEDACDDEDSACPGQFACNDGTCIPQDWKCDGEYEDCSAGEDEQSCDGDDAAGCTGDDFECGDGTCIAGDWKCDAIVDCEDGLDEASCGGGEGCSAAEFTCGDGACITETWQCDGIVDCGNGSDEADCGDASAGGDPSGGTEPCDGFECEDGMCISAAWQCDGIVDCSNEDDEYGCPEDPSGEDPSGDDPSGGETCDGFECWDDTCIAASWECDGYEDCSEAEDEWCG